MATSSSAASPVAARAWHTWTPAVLCVVTYFGARGVLEMQTIATAWRVVAALTPVPFFGWLLYRVVRNSRDLDEMQRRMQLEALAMSYGFVFMVLLTLGLVELALPLNKDDWSYRHVWQLQGLTYVMSLFFTYRRYGVTDK